MQVRNAIAPVGNKQGQMPPKGQMPAKGRSRKVVLPSRKSSYNLGTRRQDYKTLGIYAVAGVFTLYMLSVMVLGGRRLTDDVDFDARTPARQNNKRPTARRTTETDFTNSDEDDVKVLPRSRKYGGGLTHDPDDDPPETFATKQHTVKKPAQRNAKGRDPPAAKRQQKKAKSKRVDPEEEEDHHSFDKARLAHMLEETIDDALSSHGHQAHPTNRGSRDADELHTPRKTAEEFLSDFDSDHKGRGATTDPYLNKVGSQFNVVGGDKRGGASAGANTRQRQARQAVSKDNENGPIRRNQRATEKTNFVSNEDEDDDAPFERTSKGNSKPGKGSRDDSDDDMPFERKTPQNKRQEPKKQRAAERREGRTQKVQKQFGDEDDASFFHKTASKHHPSFHEQEEIDDEELGNPLDDYENMRRHNQGYDDDDEFGAEVEEKLASQYKPMRDPPGPLRFSRDGVALNFNWTEYLRMYPELRMSRVTTEQAARQHYAQYGRNEGRLPRVPQIYMQYTACKMVYEQFYSHLAAFVIARELRAELVLPPSLIKDADGFWQPMFLEAVMNVSAVLESAFEVGQMFHKVHAADFASMPDFNEEGFREDNAYPEYKYLDTPEKYIIRVGNLYNSMRSLREIIDEIYNRIGALSVKDFKNGDWGGGSEFTLLLDLPCTYFALDARTALQHLQDASHLLYFPQHLIHMADDAIKALAKKGVKKFNGFIIKDHEDWLAYTTSKFPTYWYKYKKAIEHELKNSTLPCYVGFEELVDVQKGWDKLNRQLIDSTQGCPKVFTKYQLLDEDSINKLHDQQQSLVDFMVLYRARLVMGNYRSLMALFLNEYRHSKGTPKGRVVRVQTKIETDKDDNEVDHLSWGGVFTTRHNNGLKDLPQLFLGPKGYKLKQKQHAVKYNPFKNLS